MKICQTFAGQVNQKNTEKECFKLILEIFKNNTENAKLTIQTHLLSKQQRKNDENTAKILRKYCKNTAKILKMLG